MRSEQSYTATAAKRRTTLTLPADSLLRAERIARARRVNLSTVIAEALSDVLRAHTAAERSEEVLSAYKKAFTGFSAAEMAVLDGICSSPPSVVDGSPASGPFLFDTSAESWLARSHDAAVRGWFRDYLSIHRVHVSAVTVVERIRGYALLSRRTQPNRREASEAARVAYLSELGRVCAESSHTPAARPPAC